MEQAQERFHVLAQGQPLGPYDRRTIVGMCIRQTLSGGDVLLDAAGNRLTVGDLLTRQPPQAFEPQRTGSFSVVRAVYAGCLLDVEGDGLSIPSFQGEVEIRLQVDVLRISGRFRRWWRWREDRVKLPLQAIEQLRQEGSRLALGLRPAAGRPLQVVRLELFSSDAAADLARQLPAPAANTASVGALAPAPATSALWVAVAAGSFVAAVLVAVLLLR